MGWPIRGKPFQQPPATPSAWVQEARLYPLTLDVVRHAAQVYGVLHAYHRALTDVDNDLFFRIGLLVDQTSLTERVRETLETEARQFLSTQPPLISTYASSRYQSPFTKKTLFLGLPPGYGRWLTQT